MLLCKKYRIQNGNTGYSINFFKYLGKGRERIYKNGSEIIKDIFYACSDFSQFYFSNIIFLTSFFYLIFFSK